MKHRKGYLYKRTKDGRQLPPGSREPGIYYLEYKVAGKRVKESLGVTNLEDAETERNRRMAPLMVADEEQALESITQRLNGVKARRKVAGTLSILTDEAWSTYEKTPNRPDAGEVTLRHYACQFGRFVRWMKDNHPDLPALRDVTSEIAAEYAEDLTKAKYSSNTYNKHVRLLELVFRVLEDKAGMERNPWSKITRKKLRTQSRRELTVEELKEVCGKSKGELKTLLALGLYTGMRLGDCCTLRWAEVDLRRRVIIRIPNKTARTKGQAVRIPVHPVLQTILEETPRKQRGEYVMSGMAEEYDRASWDVTNRIRAHFETCGIRTHKKGTGLKKVKGKDGKERKVHTGKRAVVEVGFHSLRHSFVSLCRDAGTPLAVVEAIVGHSNPAMTRHYTHVGDLAASQAVAALPAFVGANEASIQPSAKELLSSRDREIVGILEKSSAETWEKDRSRVLTLLREGHLEEAAC